MFCTVISRFRCTCLPFYYYYLSFSVIIEVKIQFFNAFFCFDRDTFMRLKNKESADKQKVQIDWAKLFTHSEPVFVFKYHMNTDLVRNIWFGSVTDSERESVCKSWSMYMKWSFILLIRLESWSGPLLCLIKDKSASNTLTRGDNGVMHYAVNIPISKYIITWQQQR